MCEGGVGEALSLTSPGEVLHVPHDAVRVSSRLIAVHLPRHDVRQSGGAAAHGARSALQALDVLLPQRHDAAVHVLQDVALCKHKGTVVTPALRHSHTSTAGLHNLLEQTHTQLPPSSPNNLHMLQSKGTALLSYRQEQQYSAQSESVIKMGKPQNLTHNVTICKIKKNLLKLILIVADTYC